MPAIKPSQYQEVLVLGSNGFIGSAISNHINRFHSRTIKLKTWKTKENGSLFQENSFKKYVSEALPDIVVNCAWLPTSNPLYRSNEDNFLWETKTFELHQICHDLGIFIISIGTASEDNVNEQNHYINSKRNIYTKLDDAGFLKSACWLMPSYIFSYESLRPNLLRVALQNKERLASIVKNPTLLNDYIHIFDVVSALMFAIYNKVQGKFITKSGFQMQNWHLVNRVISHPESFQVNDTCLENDINHSSWYPKFTQQIIQAYNGGF